MNDFDFTIEDYIGHNDRDNEVPKKKAVPNKIDRTYMDPEKNREKLIENATPYEKMFREILDHKGVKYEFQKIIRRRDKGYYIVDFFIPAKGGYRSLVIEIDGCIHDNIDQKCIDRQKDTYMRQNHFRVKRIRNEEVEFRYNSMKENGLL